MEQKTEDKKKEEIIKQVQQITKLTSMFKRQNLQNNSYLISRMKMSLEIPQYYVLNERSIKTVSTNHDQIKEALKSVDNITYDEKEQIITPKLNPLLNTVNVQDIDINQFMDSTQSFLHDKKYHQNMNKLVFESEDDAKKCVDQFQNHKLQNVTIKLDLEKEQSVYLSLYNKMHEQKMDSYQQNQNDMNLDPNQLMMMNMMFMNPLMMMSFMQQNQNQDNNGQYNQFQNHNLQDMFNNMQNTNDNMFNINNMKKIMPRFFIRKSQNEDNIQQTTQIEEKITIQKKEPRKSQKVTEPPKRKESYKSYKGGKVVYYEQKESDTMIEMNVKDMEDQNLYKPDKELEKKYSEREIKDIFMKFNKSEFKMKESLLKYESEGLVSEQFNTLEIIQPSTITEEMMKMTITSYQNTPQQGPSQPPLIN